MPRGRGFTLLEVIIVIVIILILMGMLLVGMRYLGQSGKEKSTRVAMSNGQSFVAELETTAGSGSRLPTGAVAAPSNVNVGSGERMNDAVRLTREVMRVLRTVPSNLKTMNQLPAASMGFVEYVPGTSYRKGDEVLGPDGKTIFTTGQDTTVAPPGSPWVIAATPAPLLMDHWRNPIVFVPAADTSGTYGSVPAWRLRYGLYGVDVRDGPQDQRVVNPGGIDVSGAYPAEPANQSEFESRKQKLRHFRPFFVSAGPDGNFQTHDDNLYSFDN